MKKDLYLKELEIRGGTLRVKEEHHIEFKIEMPFVKDETLRKTFVRLLSANTVFTWAGYSKYLTAFTKEFNTVPEARKAWKEEVIKAFKSVYALEIEYYTKDEEE